MFNSYEKVPWLVFRSYYRQGLNYLTMFKIFFKEIGYRFGNFCLTLLGVFAAVFCVVLFVMMTTASQNETRILTRNMGFNLKIIPKETNMNDFWISAYSNSLMPEDYVKKIVDSKSFSYAHLTATLHKKIEWREKEIIMTGISPDELETTGKKKSKMIFAIPKGKVYVAYEIAKGLGIKVGDRINVLGRDFLVEKTLAEVGSNDDVRMFFDLGDLQQLLHLEGKINEIMALNCVCNTPGADPLTYLRDDLEKILPQGKIIMNRTIAVAREKQRQMVDKYMALLLPVFLTICAIWIITFSILNVMQRKTEIALFRSLGFGVGYIIRLIVFRAILVGLVGAVLAYYSATYFGIHYGPEVFSVTARSIKALPHLLYYSLLLAPTFAFVASLLSIVIAVSQEPAKVLKEN